MVEKKISLEKASFSDQIHLLNPTIAFYFMMVVFVGGGAKYPHKYTINPPWPQNHHHQHHHQYLYIYTRARENLHGN